MPSTERDFPPSGETTARWSRRQKTLMVVPVLLGLLALVRIAVAKGSGIGPVLISIVVLFALVGAYVMYRRSPRFFPSGALWAGMGTLQADALRGSKFDGSIAFKSNARLNYWTGGRQIVSARMEVRDEGLRWDMRIQGHLVGATGFVAIPWQQTQDVQVGDVPGLLNRGLGGGYTVTLKNGTNLDGQFLGSRKLLLKALSSSFRR